MTDISENKMIEIGPNINSEIEKDIINLEKIKK